MFPLSSFIQLCICLKHILIYAYFTIGNAFKKRGNSPATIGPEKARPTTDGREVLQLLGGITCNVMPKHLKIQMWMLLGAARERAQEGIEIDQLRYRALAWVVSRQPALCTRFLTSVMVMLFVCSI